MVWVLFTFIEKNGGENMAKRGMWGMVLTVLSPVVLALLGLWALATSDFQVFGLSTRPAVLIFGWAFVVTGMLGLVGWVQQLMQKLGL